MYTHPLNRELRTTSTWMRRYDSARVAINPETGERIQRRTELQRYNGLVDNAWANQY